MVSPAQLSVLRMVPIAHRIVRSGAGNLAVFRLLNSVRGWDSKFTPVKDVQWALSQLEARFGDIPVGLVGHSLGGRAALSAAGESAVASVVALAPWLYPQEPPVHSAGPVLIVHGDHDRIASADRSLAYARALSRTGSRVGYITVAGGKHAMLRRHEDFGALAADFTAATLLGAPARVIPEQMHRLPSGLTNATV